MESEQPGYREIIQEIADHQGIEHGNGMPQQGKSDMPLPVYEKSNVGHHLFTWHDDITGETFRIQIAHPMRSGQDFWCVLTIQYRRGKGSDPIGILNGKRWNLTSTTNTDSHIRSLNRRMKDRAWDARLALVEEKINAVVEIGEDLVDLSVIENPPPAQYSVWPFLEHGEHNIIAADGGSTKSFMAMALAVSYSYKLSVIPGTTTPLESKPTLYLDYESSSTTQAWRRRQLLEGMSVAEQAGKIFYKKMYSPIQDASTELYDIIHSRDIGLVIIDSGSRAVGGETSTESMVIPYFNAVASWGVTILTIAHKAKDRESKGPAGVAQWWNQARNYWELVKDQTPGQKEVHLSCRHDKANDESLHNPLSFRLEFGDHIKYHPMDAPVSTDIMSQLPLATQVSDYLLNNPQSTAKEIAAGLERSEQNIGNELRKNEGKLYYGSSEKYNRRWSLMDENEKQPEMGWEKD